MSNIRLTSILACALLLFACGALAQAQPQRTFVSGTGSDTDGCLRLTPCRSFQKAHDAVAAGGEVVALDSAGYGKLTITKSVTLSGTGVNASISAASGNGITIDAGSSDVVVLRDLMIHRHGEGNRGIEINTAGTVHIVRCQIERFASDGIGFFASGKLYLTETISRQNGGSGLAVSVNGTEAAQLTVEQSQFLNNGSGGYSGVHFEPFDTATIEASVTDSIFSGNAVHGFNVFPASGTVRVNITGSTAAQNGASGFNFDNSGGQMNIEYSVARGNTGSGMAVLNGTMRVSNSVATNNNFGFRQLGGTFASRQNNTVGGNGTNIAGTITPLPAT